MADTARTLSQLLAQFADNLVGAITAQDGRDLCVSAMGWQDVAPPTANNDMVDTAAIGAWFDAGSTWIDRGTKRVWLCVDGTAEDAIWVRVNTNFFPEGIITGGGDASNLPLLVQAAPAQATALVDVQDAGGDDVVVISSTGKVTIETNNDIGLLIKQARSTFHDDPVQVRNSAGSLLVNITYQGEIGFSGLDFPVQTVTDPVYTITRRDSVILADAGAASMTLILPAITDVPPGRLFCVKRMDSSSDNTLTVLPPDVNIEGGGAWPIMNQYDTIGFLSDGTQWWIIWMASDVSGGGGGTVTSVGLALPSAEWIVTGSPVTHSGTLTGSWHTQTAGTVFAGPAAGADAVPSFKAISNEFLPKGAVVALHAVIDYTSLVAAGALTTVTLNLLAPLPPDCMAVAVAYAQDTGNAFTGGTISSIFASFFVGSSGPYGTINVHNPTLPQSGAQIVTVLKNVYGDTSSNWSITFTIGGGNASQLTNGQLDCWILYTRLPD